MSLQYALKSIIDWRNISILQDSSIIKLLYDYDAFAEYPSADYVLTTMIQHGVVANIIHDYSKKKELNVESYISELYEKYGFRREVASYVICSIISCLGYNVRDIMLSSVEENTSLSKGAFDGEYKHLSFRDIEIKGPANSICEKLKKLGFQNEVKLDFGFGIEGNFAGISNCNILVCESEYISEVWKILVFTPEENQWYSLKEEYLKFKQLLISKYSDGHNVDSFEYFSEPYSEGDGYEMTALSVEKCTYRTYIKLPEGTICVAISKLGKICFSYEDSINAEKHEIAKNNVAYDQI